MGQSEQVLTLLSERGEMPSAEIVQALDALMAGLDERPDLAQEMARLLRQRLDVRGAGATDAA